MGTNGHLDGYENDKYKCDANFESDNKHQFYVVSNAVDSNIPLKRCAIRSSWNDAYLGIKDGSGKTDVQPKDDTDTTASDKHFFAEQLDNSGKFIIKNYKDTLDSGKEYLKKQGHHAHAQESYNCGEDCQFYLEDLSQSPSGRLI